MDRQEFNKVGNATLELGSYAASLRYADLPAEVVAKAKECVMDALGCCVFGVTQQWTQMMLEMVAEQGGTPQACIPGTDFRTSVSQAVLVSGTAGHGFELDDIHVAAHLHPGSLCVPVALAFAEWRKPLDGRVLLTAIVAGYEVGLRVGLAATGSHFMRGYHERERAARRRDRSDHVALQYDGPSPLRVALYAARCDVGSDEPFLHARRNGSRRRSADGSIQ